MHGNANENRFGVINDTTTVNTKFVKYQSPGFENWAEHGVEEYIKNYSSCANENSNNQAYYPKFSLVEKDLSVGLPDFNRYISKDQRKEILPQSKSPGFYDTQALKVAHRRTNSVDKNIVPFKLINGRDNLYQKQHGLPKYSKEEMKSFDKQYKKSVDMREFLPNSIINSQKKKMHSNTFLTQKLDLYKVRGGFGNGSDIFDRQRFSESIAKENYKPMDLNDDGIYEVSSKKEGFGL